jgi:hypothetical protein
MAKATQMKEVGNALRSVSEPTTLHINLDKFKMPPEHLKLGSKMTLIVQGKVTSSHQDSYGKRLTLEIQTIKHTHENTYDEA